MATPSTPSAVKKTFTGTFVIVHINMNPSAIAVIFHLPSPISHLPRSSTPPKKENRPVTDIATGRFNSGNDLLSRALETHYHRRCRVSLPGSRWDRVGPRLSGHQTTVPLGGFPSRKRTSSDRQSLSKNPAGVPWQLRREIKVSAHSSRGGIGKNSICASLRIKKTQ